MKILQIVTGGRPESARTQDGIQWCTLLDRNGYGEVRRYRFFDGQPIDPALYSGQPEESIELAREIFAAVFHE